MCLVFCKNISIFQLFRDGCTINFHTSVTVDNKILIYLFNQRLNGFNLGYLN